VSLANCLSTFTNLLPYSVPPLVSLEFTLLNFPEHSLLLEVEELVLLTFLSDLDALVVGVMLTNELGGFLSLDFNYLVLDVEWELV
jgi:hypothetical protein